MWVGGGHLKERPPYTSRASQHQRREPQADELQEQRPRDRLELGELNKQQMRSETREGGKGEAVGEAGEADREQTDLGPLLCVMRGFGWVIAQVSRGGCRQAGREP